MDDFLELKDSLSELINEKAKQLFKMNASIPVNDLDLPGVSDFYFKKNHNSRPFFSIQTAAELLYRSIKKTGKQIQDITIMDYGAGIGNVYLLAKLIGCKYVIHNDLYEDMSKGAKEVAEYLDIHIDRYIIEDHFETLKILKKENIECDIIISRNVIEHIYDLKQFYQDMYDYQPEALLYFSTSANYHNPANLIYHKRIHKRFEEEEYIPKRRAMIKEMLPDLNASSLETLTLATRGLGKNDFTQAIMDYAQKGIIPDPSRFGTNACDPESGMWIENIIPEESYRAIIEPIGYTMEFLPAFWDTHYSSKLKTILGKTMNGLTQLLGEKKGLWTTSFVYIVAYKKS